LKPRRRNPLLRLCLAALMTLGVIGGAAYLLLWGAGALLVVADPVHRADALVLLSGGGPERITEAAALYRDYRVGRIITTETGLWYDSFEQPVTLFIHRELIRQGIPADSIITTPGRAASTYDEARSVREILAARGLDSCIVVTDPFHTARTRLIFRRVLQGSGMTVQVRPAREHWYRANTWFLSWRGWQVTLLEYAKLLANFLGIRR